MGPYQDFEGVNAGFAGLVFFGEAHVQLFEVGDVFGCFGEDRSLGEIVSCRAESMRKEEREEEGSIWERERE